MATAMDDRSAQSGDKQNRHNENSSEDDVDDDDEVEEEEEEEDEDNDDGDSDDDEDDVEEDDDSDGDSEEGEEKQDFVRERLKSRYQAVCDFEGQHDGDLKFKSGELLTVYEKRDDGWWKASNENAEHGMVPSTFLKEIHHTDSATPSTSKKAVGSSDAVTSANVGGRRLWKKVKRMVQKQSEHDVLAALGALPPNCCDTVLGRRRKEDDSYSLGSALLPKLSESGLHFCDLNWDSSSKQLMRHDVRIQRRVIVLTCKNILELGPGWDVSNRYLYICLWDGKRIISNIHTIAAGWNPRSPKVWTFTTKTTSNTSSVYNSEFVVRSSSTSDVALLVEMCVFYRKISSGETGEVSCGWISLPLVEKTTGTPAPSRTYSMDVRFGVPFRKLGDGSPPAASMLNVNPLKAMIQRQQKPLLILKLLNLPKSQQTHLTLLPDHVVCYTNWLPLLTRYRQILADVIYNYRISPYDTSLIHSPFLKWFPVCTHQPDIMDALNVMWTEVQRSEKRVLKGMTHKLNRSFQWLFVETVYSLIQVRNFSPFNLCNSKEIQIRKEMIDEIVRARSKKQSLSLLLSSKMQHTPFDAMETAFDVLH